MQTKLINKITNEQKDRALVSTKQVDESNFSLIKVPPQKGRSPIWFDLMIPTCQGNS